MNNSEVAPPRGPEPSTRPVQAPAVTSARNAVLAALGEIAAPARIAELAAATGLHPNTLREHLTALVASGAVRCHRSEPHGRGRPARLYERIDPVSTSEYVGLSIALAAVIAEGTDARERALAAGLAWGNTLRRGPASADPQRTVVEVLDRMGFSPESDPAHGRIRLTRCPLLDAARRHQDVVCSVHLGMLRALVPDGVSLLPFAEPRACVVELATARA